MKIAVNGTRFLTLSLLASAFLASLFSAGLAAEAPLLPVPVADSSFPSLTSGSASNKNVKEAEESDLSGNKTPASVKEVIKHLNSTTENVTLDDLNSARQAVVRIEALIDVEKHMAELEKIRQERSGASLKTLAAALPASALAPPPPMPMPISSFPHPSAPSAIDMPDHTLSTVEISRITGGAGHYTALVKTKDGKLKPIKVGDHLEDGNIVFSITSDSVEVGHEGGKKQTLHVSNVGTVFGSAP